MALSDKAWDWAAAQMTALKDYPGAAVACIVIGFIIAFFVVRYIYEERLTIKDERLKQARELADDYRNKLQGATPAEAAKAIQELQARVHALEPRRLTEEQIQAMAQVLKAFGVGSISIASDGACADCGAYAGYIAKAASIAGWTVRTYMMIGPAIRPPSGVGLGVSDPNKLSDREQWVANSLSAANITFELHSIRMGPPSSEIQLTVTSPLK